MENKRFLIIYHTCNLIIISFLKGFHIFLSSIRRWKGQIMEEYEEIKNDTPNLLDLPNAFITTTRIPDGKNYKKLY